MKTQFFSLKHYGLALGTLLLAATTCTAWAANHVIDGIAGPSFTFTAKDGYVGSSEGNSIYFWGFANGSGSSAVMQYPGPTMIVNQGEAVTVTLYNELPVPVSLLFPGQAGVATADLSAGSTAIAGPLTLEVPAGEPGAPSGPVTYTFTASQAGTYLYQSGSRQDLETEMGLVGALIVRPTGFSAASPRAYDSSASAYDHEQLFLLTDVDENIHVDVEWEVWMGPLGDLDAIDMTRRSAQYWFMNGRSGFDTMQPSYVPWLPHQPYDSLVLALPTEKILMRVIDAGRDRHPLHHHGNHARVIAHDGRLLESTPGAGPDLGYDQFTVSSSPASTVDQIWTWSGEKLGWDVYGHAPGDPLKPGEYAPDHGKPFPTKLPSAQDVTYGMLYSGSPFLGQEGALPPGEGGFNPGVFMFMWHSHAERELCDGNVFPGGMMTFCLIAAP